MCKRFRSRHISQLARRTHRRSAARVHGIRLSGGLVDEEQDYLPGGSAGAVSPFWAFSAAFSARALAMPSWMASLR